MYSGQDRLDEDNPIKVLIGPYEQTIGSFGWTQFTVTSERRYRFPLDKLGMYPAPANYRLGYGSGYFMVFIHDIGNDLVSIDHIDPVDVAGIYKEVEPNITMVSKNVVYGAFKFTTGTPVFGKSDYSIDFSLPPLPAADAFEVDDVREVGTFIDYADLPVRQYHTFHDEGNGKEDYGWFQIALQAGDSLTVETFSAGGQWESNTQIDIQDSKMSYIRSNRSKTPVDCYSKLEYLNATGVAQEFHILVKPVVVGDGIEYSGIGEYMVEFRR